MDQLNLYELAKWFAVPRIERSVLKVGKREDMTGGASGETKIRERGGEKKAQATRLVRGEKMGPPQHLHGKDVCIQITKGGRARLEVGANRNADGGGKFGEG